MDETRDLPEEEERSSPEPFPDAETAAYGATEDIPSDVPITRMERDDAPLPKRIGQYRILRELGRGGMGIVLLGVSEDAGLRRRVAIKLVKKGMDTEDVLRRFDLERQLLAALNHPGIARLFEAGETDDGRPYLVMEYIEGLSLSEYADSHRLKIEERLELFSKVCDAVHYAHQNLVVHRDLKPSNVIVTESGEPKLLDFGIAKIINPEYALLAGDPTLPERRVMTPEYASPEQVRGHPVTTACDVYSLGVILYELLTGHAPYRLRSRIRKEVERVICEEEPDRPSTAISRADRIGVDPTTGRETTVGEVNLARGLRPERLRRRLAGDLDNIVLMAMRKEPQRRYPSAREFAEDVRRHLKGMPVSARADTVGYRMGKFVRRHRGGVAVAAMLMFSLVAGLVGTASGWQEADRRADAEAIAKAEAIEARDRADRRFDAVRELARVFLYDFHDAIQELDGALPARELLVVTAREYLEDLAAETEDRPDLVPELAAAWERVGDIRGGVRNPSLGDPEGALACYRAGLELRRAIRAKQPDDPAAARGVALALVRLGDALVLSGAVEEGLAAHGEAVALLRPIAEADPASDEAADDLAVALLAEGGTLVALGRGDEAVDRYQRSLEVRRRLADLRPTDREARRAVSVASLRVGGRLQDAGDAEGALAAFEEAVAIREALSEEEPASGRSRRDLAVALYFAGNALLTLDRLDEAIPRLERYLVITGGRAEENPTSARAQRDLAIAHEILGRAYDARGDADAAREQFEAFAAVIGPLAEAEPANANYASLAAVARERLGEARADAGDVAGAIDEGHRALAIVERLLERSDDARHEERAAQIDLQLGRWMVADGRRGEALRTLERAAGRWRALAARLPEDPGVRAGLVETLRTLADLMIGIDDRAAARAALEEAMALVPADDPRASAIAGELERIAD